MFRDHCTGQDSRRKAAGTCTTDLAWVGEVARGQRPGSRGPGARAQPTGRDFHVWLHSRLSQGRKRPWYAETRECGLVSLASRTGSGCS